MDTITPKEHTPQVFDRSADFLAGLNADTVAQIVASAADIALIIKDGVIEDVAVATAELLEEGYAETWRGKRWVDTVTPESRRKIVELLSGEKAKYAHWRQVNHPSGSALDVPVRYTTVDLSDGATVIALGHDQRSASKMQQRLVEAHQDLERDYTRMREAEARYRLLFDTVSEPVLILNAGALSVENANAAAVEALEKPANELAGSRLADLVVRSHHREVETVAAEALASGSAVSSMVTLKNGRACRLHASAFREDRAARLILRFTDVEGMERAVDSRRLLLDTLEHLPEGLLVVDANQRIVAANGSFLEMVKVVGHGQAEGRQLGDFVGRSSTDLNVMMSALRNHGVVRNFATLLRDRFGVDDSVEISAVSAPSTDGPVYGFSIRNISRRLQSSNRISEQLPRSVEQVTELVGRVPLKEIVRESTELIEKLCIEAALEITQQNRASAAEVLGLSRQGLYSKLKRAGIDSATSENDT